MRGLTSFVAIAGVVVSSLVVQADVVIDTVTVGNPGNAPDTRYYAPGYGGVDYVYSVGTFEVTAGQYTGFLNAVATTDTYGLYSTSMWTSDSGCKIQRSGSTGSYTYSVADDWADRPVNYVNFWGSLRFANWLANDQPTGLQDSATTEDGSYTLDGYTGSDGSWIVRNPEATWVLPTEDEWHKAAYHKNDGVTGNYWDYPTETDAVPSNDLIDPDPGNNANYYLVHYTVGSPYWRTEVGEFENSESPYGTFDQAGNVWEWNETLASGSDRGVRGGSFGPSGDFLHAERGIWVNPAGDGSAPFGFRVALVPEPAMVVPLALAAVGLLHRRRR